MELPNIEIQFPKTKKFDIPGCCSDVVNFMIDDVNLFVGYCTNIVAQF